MGTEGFWLFEGLDDEPYGLLPLVNLSAKVGATSTKSVERLGSYQWNLEEDDATVIIPGLPNESNYWPGGKLVPDRGVLIYDVNHLKVRNGPLDSMVLAAKLIGEKRKKEVDFDSYDFITDAINLQKLFAFTQEAGEGLFRIDCERVGKTVLLSRMEASDLMTIGHLTYDQALKQKMTKSRSKHTTGPFFQLVSYQFGSFKMLVRYEVDCGDYAAANAPPIDPEKDELSVKQKFDLNDSISFQELGEVPKNLPLQLVTTYPQAAGFPFFTWAQLFFTAADQEVVGFFKGNGDFGKPSMYALNDINKKIRLFLLRNESDFRFGLVWKGKAHLEIYSKGVDGSGAVSPKVREFLLTRCKDAQENDAGDPKSVPPPVPAASIDPVPD